MAAVDQNLFEWVNHWPEALSPVLTFFSEATTYLWFKIALLLLVIVLCAMNPKTRRTAIQALIAFPIADGSTNLLKHISPQNRPFQDFPHDTILRVGWSASHGTASAHSANMAAVAVVFTYHLGWWGSPWVPIALITGISRIYVGAHYPRQVLLGWICGIVAATLVIKTWEWIIGRRSGVAKDGANLHGANDNGAADAPERA